MLTEYVVTTMPGKQGGRTSREGIFSPWHLPLYFLNFQPRTLVRCDIPYRWCHFTHHQKLIDTNIHHDQTDHKRKWSILNTVIEVHGILCHNVYLHVLHNLHIDLDNVLCMMINVECGMKRKYSCSWNWWTNVGKNGQTWNWIWIDVKACRDKYREICDMNLSGIADSNGKEKESLIDGTGTTATANTNKNKQHHLMIQ